MKTHSLLKTFRLNPTRGGALVTVMILCLVTLMMVGGYLSYLSTQSKIAYRASLQNEARNAAEGVAAYALAEVTRRAAANPSFGVGANPNPLSGYSLDAADVSFMAPATGNNHVIASSLAFKNGLLASTPSSALPIDASDAVNADDPTKGNASVIVKSMNVFAKASVLDPFSQKQIDSYVSENIQIREESWLNYAIFYNMDIEFHAGPDFVVKGPVHTNANAYVTEGDGNKLQFFANLTAFKKIYRYDLYTGNTSGGHGGTVECINAPGMLTANLVAMGTTEDSRHVNFNTFSITKWNKFVNDGTCGVKLFNPPGLAAYIPDDFTTFPIELRNNAYPMVESQLSTIATDVDYSGRTDYGQKSLPTENLKISALAGMTIRVLPPTSIGAQPQWQLVVYQTTDPSRPVSADNLPVRDSATGGRPAELIVIDPFGKDDTDFPSPSTAAVITRALKTRLLDAIVSVPYGDQGANWGDGFSNLKSFNPRTVAVPAGHSARTYLASQFTTNWPSLGTQVTVPYYPIYDRREGYIYPNGSSSTTDGLKGAMHTLWIDMAKLNALINDTSGVWHKPYGSTLNMYNTATSWSGAVYVQFPLAPLDTTRFPPTTVDGDQIRPAQAPDKVAGLPGYALLLANASTLPQSTIGSTPPDGFTIATNGPLYIWGHYNADGDSGTGSSTTPDTAAEVPALVAADAVMILSAKKDFDFRGMATNVGNAGSFTEVSAAIMTGVVPTHPGYNHVWSGGVHNLIRYLEDWSGSTYRYRGSIAVLYESEVAKSAYHEGYNDFFYNPPTRDLGYHQYFSQGRFPPATPVKRTVRRMNLQDIVTSAALGSAASQYAATPPTPPTFN